MTQASTQIARQMMEGALNKKNWGAVAYNVLVEGLVGDGVTDDTAALQALINKAIAEGRRTLLFPHGKYYVTALTNADKVDFVGDNSSFVGGYSGTISNLGGFAELKTKDIGRVFNVVGYGADPTGVMDSSPGVNAAIAACKAAGGGIVHYPDGNFKHLSVVVIDVPMIIEGVGRYSSLIKSPSQTNDVFQVSAYGAVFRDLNISQSSGLVPTAGAGIKLINGAFATVTRVEIGYCYHGFDCISAASFTLDNCYFVNNYKYGAFIKNEASGDTGDQTIINCTFDENVGADAAIRHESGGGLKLSKNKMNRHKYGYDLQVADGVGTSVLTMTGNSLENQTVANVRLGRKGTTGTYGLITITGNEFSSGAKGIQIGAGIKYANLGTNVYGGGGAGTCIDVQGGQFIKIFGESINAFGTGVNVAAVAKDVTVAGNDYNETANLVVNQIDTIANISQVAVEHSKSSSTASTTVYTNLYTVQMHIYRGCEIEVLFEGVLNGVSAVVRKIRKVVSRDGGACVVTDVQDVKGGATIDVQFDTVTSTGSVIVGVKRNAAAGGSTLDLITTIKVTGSANKVAVS